MKKNNITNFYCENQTLISVDSNVIIFDIPEGVVRITPWCFSDCKYLKKVTIPKTMNFIDYHSFENCSNLDNIIIPKNVNSILNWAFNGCEKLQNVIIQNDNTEVGYGAFNECYNLTYIESKLTEKELLKAFGDDIKQYNNYLQRNRDIKLNELFRHKLQ